MRTRTQEFVHVLLIVEEYVSSIGPTAGGYRVSSCLITDDKWSKGILI